VGQRCWAHLLQDIEAMIERRGRSQEIGAALKSQAHQMLHWWHRVREDTAEPVELPDLYEPRD
jgi:hypothetical protein